MAWKHYLLTFCFPSAFYPCHQWLKTHSFYNLSYLRNPLMPIHRASLKIVGEHMAKKTLFPLEIILWVLFSWGIQEQKKGLNKIIRTGNLYRFCGIYLWLHLLGTVQTGWKITLSFSLCTLRSPIASFNFRLSFRL